MKHFRILALFAFVALFAVGPPAYASDGYQGNLDHIVNTDTDTSLSTIANPYEGDVIAYPYDGDIRQHTGLSVVTRTEHITLHLIAIASVKESAFFGTRGIAVT